MRQKLLIVSALAFFLFARIPTFAQNCPGGCSDPNCACCDCDGNCLIDSSGGCCGTTPIVIDVSGKGFLFTSAQDGVDFGFLAKGKKMRISWTAASSENGWLVLDRNHNGVIDNGIEMFGSITPQPNSKNPNGFLALAVFDRPENGGDDDGIIDAKDRIYSSLRVWIDKNHNGISEPDEMFTLPQLDIVSINLHYYKSEKVDQFGNRFRYKSTIVSTSHAVDKVIHDFFLTVAHPQASPEESSNAKEMK